MADFADKTALGTSRMNPSSMVPGARGNAPQNGAATQRRAPVRSPQASPANPQQGKQALANQLAATQGQIMQPQNRLVMPKQPQSQSSLPTQVQQMLPVEKKGRSYKKEDFQLLSDVFKTLSEQ